MTGPRNRHPIAQARVRVQRPGVDRVRVRAGIPYTSDAAGERALNIYDPPLRTARSLPPVVILVSGLPDPGAQPLLGCPVHDMASFVDWARLVATSGMTAVTFATGDDPAEDLRRVLHHLTAHGRALGIDASRIGLWACSSHAPNALGVLTERGVAMRCAALLYGYALDLGGATAVADAQRTWRFANPCAGRSAADLAGETAILIVRAGQDVTPGLNDSIDRFVADALHHNRRLTLINHPHAPHAFDLADDGDATRAIISAVLSFFRVHLLQPPPRGPARRTEETQ